MISVYLDTQHISRIASERGDLKIALEESSATLFFSQTHVVESLPKRPEPPDQELLRLQFIMGPQSQGLIPWSDFPKKEFEAEGPSLDNFRCETNEILFPDKILMHRNNLLKQTTAAIKKVLSQISDANEKRSQQAKFIKRGRLTPAAINLFIQQLESTTSDVASSAGFLLPLLSDGGIYDFIAGKTSERDFNALFKQTVANPVVLAGLIDLPELGSLLDMSKFFWTQTDILIGKLNEIVDQLVTFQIQTNNFDYKSISKFLRTGPFSENFKERISSSLVGKPVSPEKLKAMPGTKLYIEALFRYLLEKLDKHANAASNEFLKEIKFKRGDFADLNHLFYAPYVSVFGCDRATKDLVRRTGLSVTNFTCSDEEVKEQVACANLKDSATTTSST